LPNWNHIVRDHLAALRLRPEREIEIVEELALHLDGAYEDALADVFPEEKAIDAGATLWGTIGKGVFRL
jgi:hypothetical protein